MEWIHKINKNSTSNETLPNKIVMELPFGNESAKLEFVKRQNFTHNIKVITSFKGKPEEWEPEATEVRKRIGFDMFIYNSFDFCKS